MIPGANATSTPERITVFTSVVISRLPCEISSLSHARRSLASDLISSRVRSPGRILSAGVYFIDSTKQRSVPYVVAPDRPQREKSMKPNEADYFVCRCRLRNSGLVVESCEEHRQLRHVGRDPSPPQ